MAEGDDVKKTDLTVAILKDIRQELRGLVTRVDETNARLDQTNDRLEGVARRVVESEVRTSTAITALAGDVRELTAYLRTQGDLRPRVERCERDIAELQAKARPAS